MSRNLYILAASLVLLAVLSFGMSWTPGANQPGLPGEAILWRMMAVFLFLLGVLSGLIGSLTHLFEQASRRHDEQQAQKDKQ